MEQSEETQVMTERELRNKLKELSMDLFGSSSRYQKFRTRTVPVTLEVVAENGDITKNQALSNGIKLMTTKNFTDEELLVEMENMLMQRTAYLAKLAQDQADKNTAQKIANEVSGSAV